jgi:hypothetical protein
VSQPRPYGFIRSTGGYLIAALVLTAIVHFIAVPR